MRARLVLACLVSLCVLAPAAGASVQKDLEKAATKGKVAFVLVTEPTATGVEQARDVIRQVLKQVEKSTMVELDRSDPANAGLVAQYRLASAPVPLIIVMARSGILVGGITAATATAERLVGLVPSPKKAEVMQALQGGNAVFLLAARQGMSTQAAALTTCTTACVQMGGNSIVIPIDMDDPAEAGFLEQLKIDLAAAEPVIIVMNAQGQLTGTYTGALDVANLVQAATRRATGCCPSSVQNPNPSCPPKK